jgi:hypothetical protein
MSQEGLYGRLRKSRLFKTLTGVSPEAFEAIRKKVAAAWRRKQKKKILSGRPYKLGGLEEHLAVLLILYRCHLTQDTLAFFCRVDKATICRSFKRIEALVLRYVGLQPCRKVTEQQAKEILIDVTERPIRRPKDKEARKVFYSGKKKRHTEKIEVIVRDGDREILGVSEAFPGSTHDFTMRRRGPPIEKTVRAYVDSAYQGYHTEHAALDYPYKKSKGKDLCKDEREYNEGLSRIRVPVEHVIGKIKKFRICSEINRYGRASSGKQFRIVAGVINLAAHA